MHGQTLSGSGSSGRRLLQTTTATTTEPSGTGSIDFAALLAAMLAALAASFSNTPTDPGAFLGVIFLIVTIAMMYVIGLLACVYGVRKDLKERRIRELVRAATVAFVHGCDLSAASCLIFFFRRVRCGLSFSR
jgi:peptidoglycan/LPS O-acetylase OafA/YrhL